MVGEEVGNESDRERERERERTGSETAVGVSCFPSDDELTNKRKPVLVTW